MPVDADTESYIADHFEKLRRKQTYSDPKRAEMAERLAERFKDTPKERKKPRAERPKDEAYETFKAVYAEARSIPYRSVKADGAEEYVQLDFIKLAEMRRRMGIPATETPLAWERTCRNYMTSDYITRYTIADLCTRIDIFMRGPIRKNDATRQDGKFIQTHRNGQGVGAIEGGAGAETRTARGERTFTRKS